MHPIPRRFILSGWLVEGDLNRLTRGGETLQLEPKAIDVLCRLAATPGEVVSREALLQAVWPGRAVVDQVLTRAIGQLRSALGDEAQKPRLIETVARRGYRLLPGIEVSAAPGAVPPPGAMKKGRGWAWILAGTALALLALVAVLLARRPAGEAPLRAVAVRPFKVLSGSDVPEYYAEGLAEGLITALSRVPDLKVIAGGSAFDRGLADAPLAELGGRLGVEGVIEGSVQGESDELRATVRLVRVRDGQVVWAGSARRLGAGEWFALQDQVVAQVLATMAKPSSRASSLPPTLDTTAHQHYLRGRRLWNQRTPAALQEALAEFRRALDADPAYAQAHAGLAQSYGLLPFYGLSPPGEAMPRARAAAEEALAIDPDLAEAHAVRAVVHYQYEHDWAAAAGAFERALRASPSDATTRQWYAEFLGYAGRFEESRAQIEQAAVLDPLSPVVATLRASPDAWAGRCETAQRQLDAALALAPEFPLALYSRALCYRAQNRLDDAIAIYRRLLPRLGEGFVLASLANAEAAHGDRAGARAHAQALDRLAERVYVPPYKFAVIHAGLGEREQAFARLEQAFAQSDERLVLLDVDPHLEPLRQDPRFAELRRRVGLPVDPRPGS
jgi:DNA-binding winged helix-turn-helix (wHTH) protein/TolB-like protein/Tfp pilus assembly protein PilF